MTHDEARTLRPGEILARRIAGGMMEVPMTVARKGWVEAVRMVVCHRNLGILGDEQSSEEEYISPADLRRI